MSCEPPAASGSSLQPDMPWAHTTLQAELETEAPPDGVLPGGVPICAGCCAVPVWDPTVGEQALTRKTEAL
jgi:hypothetical protein